MASGGKATRGVVGSQPLGRQNGVCQGQALSRQAESYCPSGTCKYVPMEQSENAGPNGTNGKDVPTAHSIRATLVRTGTSCEQLGHDSRGLGDIRETLVEALAEKRQSCVI